MGIGADATASWRPTDVPLDLRFNQLMKDRDKTIEETENLPHKQARERAREVERGRRGTGGKDLDPSPGPRTVQPSDRTRMTEDDSKPG